MSFGDILTDNLGHFLASETTSDILQIKILMILYYGCARRC